MLPLKYTIRNLRVRWVTTLMTLLATAMVVWVSVLTFGMVEGLSHALRISGEPLDVIIMRDGSDDEISSTITEQAASEIATRPEIMKDGQGNALVSPEYVTILTKPRRGNRGTVNMIVRGLTPVGRQLRPGFKIIEGRDVEPGINELITSKTMADRFENLRIGEQLEINKINFTVVGYFVADGSSAESEAWADLRDVTSASRVQGAISIVNARANDEVAMQKLIDEVTTAKQFRLKAITEKKYYEDQAEQGSIITYVGYVIAAFLTFGAMFAAANTMFAAVSGRSREIGALRAIGFTQGSILSAFMRESILLCLLGGVLGCLLVLPLSGMRAATMGAQFSELTFGFRFGPATMMKGILLALAMGVLGGLFPAIRAMRLKITDALRSA
jgi:putative ABC transport system permease protein